jgi:hypothetical protein
VRATVRVRARVGWCSESYGWEAQFFEGGELFYSRAGFVTRALAVQWADEERKAIDRLANAEVRRNE